MMVVTRFAPSPTGFLHIGSARTALFNYLFARHNKGKFLLRIEDTDSARSTKEAVEAIFDGLKWLGLDFDGEVIFQSQRAEIYQNAARKLLETGEAYHCFTPQEEIERQRALAIEKKEHFIFKSKWRDADASTHPLDVKPVLRLKINHEGKTIIHDELQGDVVIDNSHIDDMVLLRSDGSATYMLAVVIDDIEMGITHIIRGDDHLTNAARQIMLYNALGAVVPSMTHIPLIHGSDGAKLSKRHGALGIDAYRDMGYLPEALCNYLLRLGWGHKNEEILDINEAIELFGLEGLGKSPARLDFAKMNNLNSHYLRLSDNDKLLNIIIQILNKTHKITEIERLYIANAMDSLKIRANTLVELANSAMIYLDIPLIYSEEARNIIKDVNLELLSDVVKSLRSLTNFDKDSIQNMFKEIAARYNMKLGDLMLIIRAFVTGSTSSPSLFEIISILGMENTINRLKIK